MGEEREVYPGWERVLNTVIPGLGRVLNTVIPGLGREGGMLGVLLPYHGGYIPLYVCASPYYTPGTPTILLYSWCRLLRVHCGTDAP